MAFYVPTPVPGKGIRRNIASVATYYKNAEEQFKPTTDLFCSKCIAQGQVNEAYGFCKVCMDFLCRRCVDKHESTLLTLNHGIITGNEMMEKYHNAMRKDKKEGRSISKNYVDMIADGRATFQYIDDRTSSNKNNYPTQNAELIKQPKVRLGTDVRKCFICACTIYNDGKIVLADANNKCLKLFSKHFDFLFIFHMKHEPWDMCRAINKDEDLFVTETSVRGIHQFKVTKDIQYVFTVKVEGECFGITSWKGGVAVSVKNKGDFNIKLLDQFGNIHRNIDHRFERRLKILSPWYLTSIKNGKELLISDASAGTISCIDVDGGIKFIYKDGRKMRDPRNITSDDNDNIYVIEYETDTVHHITSTGENAGVVLCAKDGLNNPCAICCFNGMIYIQAKMDSTNLQVYNIKH